MRGDGPTVFAQVTNDVGPAQIAEIVLAAWRQARTPSVFHQHHEECPVVLHGLPEVLGVDVAVRLTGLGDGVRAPVALDDVGMIDRDDGGAILEVLHGVAALAHHALDQPVGVADGVRRVVDERGLRPAPGVLVAGARARCERTEFELVMPGLALAQLLFGCTPIAGGLDGAVVFSCRSPRAAARCGAGWPWPRRYPRR